MKSRAIFGFAVITLGLAAFPFAGAEASVAWTGAMKAQSYWPQSSCRPLGRKALRTGSRFWWRRYFKCMVNSDMIPPN